MKKIIFWLAIIGCIIVVIVSCAKKDDSSSTTTSTVTTSGCTVVSSCSATAPTSSNTITGKTTVLLQGPTTSSYMQLQLMTLTTAQVAFQTQLCLVVIALLSQPEPLHLSIIQSSLQLLPGLLKIFIIQTTPVPLRLLPQFQARVTYLLEIMSQDSPQAHLLQNQPVPPK